MISREVESLVDIFIFSGWLGDIRCSKVFACTGQDIDMCQILLVAISDTDFGIRNGKSLVHRIFVVFEIRFAYRNIRKNLVGDIIVLVVFIR